MSGSIAAIAAYDGTGTQGYGTTDKNLPGVKSIFWNENDTDKYYVNGSAIVEIPVNNSEIAFDNTQAAVFTFPNDVDAVGAIYVQVTVNGPTNLNIASSPNGNTPVIDLIELCVGNQIIVSKNFTEVYSITSTGYTDQGNTISGKTIFLLDLNLMSYGLINGNGLNFSYLMACANNQTLQLKIYPSTSATLSAQGFSSTSWTSVNFEVFSRVYSMVNDERNFLRNQVIPKLFPVTQYSDRVTFPSSPSPETPIIVNCDSFNIDAQSINIFIPGNFSSGNVGFDVELFLNSSSYSGLVPFTVGQFPIGNAFEVERPLFRLNLCEVGIQPCDFHKSELVPLSKYDSIRVYIYLQSNAPSGQSDLDILKNGITVVATGYCTALYQNGAVTFNNY